MHPALDRNIRVRNTRSKQLAQSPEQKDHERCNASLLLNQIFELLEYGVLQNRVDDQHQSRHDTSKQCRRPLLPHQGKKCANCSRSLLSLLATQQRLVALLVPLPGCHACVDNPYRIGKENCCAAGKRAGHHALSGRQALGSSAGGNGSFLEECAGPFVPVIVDEIGDGDAEEGGVETGIETSDALALDDVSDGIEEVGVGAFAFDLGACGEGDERIAARDKVSIQIRKCIDLG